MLAKGPRRCKIIFYEPDAKASLLEPRSVQKANSYQLLPTGDMHTSYQTIAGKSEISQSIMMARSDLARSMLSRFYRSVLLGGSALLCGVLQAQAAVNLYTSEAAYLAAAGATTTYFDFAGTPGITVSGASFSPAVTFGSCPTGLASRGTQVFHNSNAITDLGGSPAPNSVAAVGGTFTVAVNAFAFHYVSGDIASLDFGGGPGRLDTSSAAGFIGIVSDTALTSFIANNAVFPGNIGNDRYFIDDFRINAAVPEPETYAMMLAGLGLVGLAARRKRQRTTV